MDSALPSPTEHLGARATAYVQDLLNRTLERNPGEPQFHQALKEILSSLEHCLQRHPEFVREGVLERLVEPERVLMFRVPWRDRDGRLRVNRGYRVEYNSAIGPYKGGMRFHPTVNLDVVKFLGFEQTFKNALTSLSLGGGKGGSDFDPKGLTDVEIENFCTSLMLELHRHIGLDTDVPAADIGVTSREIGYLFGAYRKISNDWSGVLTGKGLEWGGSEIRKEATGYGAVYFAHEMLNSRGDDLIGKRCLVSGAGNVAQYTIEKLLDLGAIPISCSDSRGIVLVPNGFDREKLELLKQVKNVQRASLERFADHFGLDWLPHQGGRSHSPLWAQPGADCAFPCATQNEISLEDARHLADNGVRLVVEGANMPTTAAGVDLLRSRGVLFAPGKAANAGGVAVSGLEMAQNRMGTRWTRSEVDGRLVTLMKQLHQRCVETAGDYGEPDDYVLGANIAGFLPVAHAMLQQGRHA